MYGEKLSSWGMEVHPAFDHHALLCYDDKPPSETTAVPPVAVSMPPPPNICVEAGRIQFVRREEEGATVAEAAAGSLQAVPRVTVTRGLQTDDFQMFGDAVNGGEEEEEEVGQVQVGG
ncbi:unnamed protein product [Acanthoscelides obtectus]|uniref:Uncharacterized protein n=1 Tax=Acanthoscelides obtectus TaxID=200917 RepID=A0A9P0L1A8_ACAOB|nr:unnamed protein product [Acanthoscelides obtectus]CAK1620140.1 hypothetical protein AOBTE_LOCUS220 [Acanthoscelides obtectus]